MLRYFFVMAVVGSFMLTGCRAPQTVKDAWKGTKGYYYEYLNTPARLNMDDRGDILDYQAALGTAVSDFDMRLQELERVLQNSDRNPDAAWVTSITTRFPWLSGVALTDDTGTPRAKVPPVFPKPFEIGNLLDVDPKQQLKDLRAFVQSSDLGAEVYVGNPVYIGADFRGVIIVHFDPRALLARTGDPGKLVIAGPDGIIWPGLYEASSIPVANINWAEEVKQNTSGVVKNDLGAFYWVCRYIGNLPLIYAIRIQGEFPLNENNMHGIAEANSFAIGPVNFASMQPPQMPESMEMPAEVTPDGNLSPLTAPGSTPSTETEKTATPLSE